MLTIIIGSVGGRSTRSGPSASGAPAGSAAPITTVDRVRTAVRLVRHDLPRDSSTGSTAGVLLAFVSPARSRATVGPRRRSTAGPPRHAAGRPHGSPARQTSGLRGRDRALHPQAPPRPPARRAQRGRRPAVDALRVARLPGSGCVFAAPAAGLQDLRDGGTRPALGPPGSTVHRSRRTALDARQRCRRSGPIPEAETIPTSDDPDCRVGSAGASSRGHPHVVVRSSVNPAVLAQWTPCPHQVSSSSARTASNAAGCSIHPRLRTVTIASGPSTRRTPTSNESQRRSLSSAIPTRRANSRRLTTLPALSASTKRTARSCVPKCPRGSEAFEPGVTRAGLNTALHGRTGPLPVCSTTVNGA